MDRGKQRLSQEKLALYRQNAKQILGSGQNLFAGMVLRILDSHEDISAELEQVKRIQEDRDLELEFLSRENKELRNHIAVLEGERRQLLERLARQSGEGEPRSGSKPNNLKLPPSWDS